MSCRKCADPAFDREYNHRGFSTDGRFLLRIKTVHAIKCPFCYAGSGAGSAGKVVETTISAKDLRELVVLENLSQKLMGRFDSNYRIVMGFNDALIGPGAFGLLTPAASALVYYSS